MRVHLFDNFDDLAPWADHWDRLAAGVPFRSWTWATTWWRHYGEQVAGRRLFVLGVFDHRNILIGLAPWYLEGDGRRNRVIRFFGSGEVCSDYLSLLAEPGLKKAVVGALAHRLLRSTNPGNENNDNPARWDMLELTGIDSRDVLVDWLAGHLALGGCTVHHQMGPPCRRTELPRTLETYLRSLSKNSRRRAHRLKRDLLDSGRAELSTVANLGELDLAMDRFIELHQRRQRMLNRSGCFASPRFTAFHRDVAARMLVAGQLRLHTLWIDRRPAATEYQFLGNGVVYAYQSGVDPMRLDLQPGHAMQLAMLTWAINNGYRAYDFLRGDESYKSHWNAERRDSMEIRVIANRPAAQLRHAVWVAGTEAKRWIRRGLHHIRSPWE
ncbi:MAG: GNAT family N-acetyltransferase [Pirellulales bacterium]|nr:GNAT family N-acetyltransferase [Pirellulales bacterium]